MSDFVLRVTLRLVEQRDGITLLPVRYPLDVVRSYAR